MAAGWLVGGGAGWGFGGGVVRWPCGGRRFVGGGGRSGSEALGLCAKAAGAGGVEAEMEFVDVLVAAADGVAEAEEDGVGGEAGEALAGAEEMEVVGAVDAGFEGEDALFDAVLGGGDELGGGGGGGGAEVGDEVGDGEVGLVADGGDDGEVGGGDGAGEGLVVEAGEVFDGAAAAGDDDQVGFVGVRVEPADAGGYWRQQLGPCMAAG